MAYVDTVPPERAGGALAALYERIAAERGAVAAIHRAASARPDLLEAHYAFYRALLWSSRGLGRRLRERIALAVSEANACRYCATHHGEALCRVGGAAPDDPTEAALVGFARKLTLAPAEIERADVEALRAAGLGDEEIVDAVFVVGYFAL
ncbi:MAG: peroxidase, partial [Planctomycetota bacterium]